MTGESEQPDRLSIVHVTTFYPPHNFGGDGVHVQRLAAALARRGHHVSVVYAPGAFSLLSPRRYGGRVIVGEPPDGSRPVTVHALGGLRGMIEPLLVQQTGRPILSRGELKCLLGGTRESSPDVIHYHNISLVGGLGVLGIGRALKLYTAHEYWLMCPTHLLFRYNREICRNRTCVRCTLRGRRPPQWWRTTHGLDKALRNLDTIVFPSRITRSVYEEHGVDRPARLMHHFLPDEYLAAAESLGSRSRDVDPYYLYVGRLDAVKGVESLVQHFARGPSPIPLHLAGDGPLEPALKKRYGESPAVRFLGNRSQEALGKLYRDALALILPSAGYEVFGQVVLEAFAHATPAIVTEVGGANELVAASQAGYVYASDTELGETVSRLASEPELRDQLGQRGRDYLRREHGEEDYVDRYEQMIRELRER